MCLSEKFGLSIPRKWLTIIKKKERGRKYKRGKSACAPFFNVGFSSWRWDLLLCLVDDLRTLIVYMEKRVCLPLWWTLKSLLAQAKQVKTQESLFYRSHMNPFFSLHMAIYRPEKYLTICTRIRLKLLVKGWIWI